MEESKKNVNLIKKRKLNKNEIILIVLVFFVILIDQITKMFVLNQSEINIIPDVLKFGVFQNTEAAYGIGNDSTLMYIITNLVILGIIFKFITSQNEYIDMKVRVFLSFILAGGISNVIDRITRGYVIEFIDFRQVVNIPVINMADLFIVIGWIGVAAIFAKFTVNEWRSKKKNKKEDNE